MGSLVILPVHLKGQPSSKYFRSDHTQVTKTFRFFKNDTGFINKLLDDQSVIERLREQDIVGHVRIFS